MGGHNCNDITVIVCTKNVEKTIEKTLQSIIANKPGEIIVVDANSTDNTRNILQKYNVKIVNDPGKGLALARQIGIEAATKKYIFFIGDDNYIEKNSLLKLKLYMLEHNWIGAGMLTRIRRSKKNYWACCSNVRWKVRIYEGERSVIGTPYIFYADILKAASYDKDMGDADDADIEKRILESNPKYKIGYSNVICQDYAKTKFEDIVERFTRYGKSDYLFWKKYSVDWGIKRKWKSITHPLRDELIIPTSKIHTLSKKIYCLPYFIIITAIRYLAWIKCAIKDTKKTS